MPTVRFPIFVFVSSRMIFVCVNCMPVFSSQDTPSSSSARTQSVPDVQTDCEDTDCECAETMPPALTRTQSTSAVVQADCEETGLECTETMPPFPTRTSVIKTTPVTEEDRALLMSIVAPTLALHPAPPPEVQEADAVHVPVSYATALCIPVVESTPVLATPSNPIPGMLPHMKRRRAESDGEQDEDPERKSCRRSLTPRFDLVARDGVVAELREIAAGLKALRFDADEDAYLLQKLTALVDQMATDASADDGAGVVSMGPLTTTLRGVVRVLGNPTRDEVLRDTLCVVSAHAQELNGAQTPPEHIPNPLGLLLSCQRLSRLGVVPARNEPDPKGAAGPLDVLLMDLLRLLVDATAATGSAEETLDSIGRTFTRLGASVVAVGGRIPELAVTSSTLIPRLAKLKDYIMSLPPGITEQAICHLRPLAAEAQAEFQREAAEPVCVVMIQSMCQAVERGGGALGLLGDACARLALAGIDRDEIKGLAEHNLAQLWRGLQWMSDTMAPVIATVLTIKEALASLDLCIDHMERDLPPQEVLHLFSTIMESSIQAARTVAKLAKPGHASLLPRLVDSVAQVTDLASECRAAMDALALEDRA